MKPSFHSSRENPCVVVSRNIGLWLVAMVIITAAPRVMAETAPVEKPNEVDAWKLELGPEYYYWREDNDGKKLLDETGTRYALEFSDKAAIPGNWLVTVRFKVYYGQIDYNGQTQLGTPVKTTTDYYGGLIDFGSGYRWTSSAGRCLDLIGRVGVENWERDLKGAGGYGEHWMPIYIKLGLETEPSADPMATGFTGALGLKSAVYTYQHVNLAKFGAGSITLHPQPMPSGYAEFGYKFTRHLSLTAYVDSYWFGKSPTASNGIIIAFQPESKTYQAGIKAGWTF